MKRIISTNQAPQAIGPYSQAVEMHGMLFISGQIPIYPATGKVTEGGIKEQTGQVLNNIMAILDAAGYSIHDVVKTTCLLADMNDFNDMNEVYGSCFGSHPPARATFAVKELPIRVKIEIEAIAIKR